MLLTFFYEFFDNCDCITRVKKREQSHWFHFPRDYWPAVFHTETVRNKVLAKRGQRFRSCTVNVPPQELICYYDETSNKFIFDEKELERGK